MLDDNDKKWLLETLATKRDLHNVTSAFESLRDVFDIRFTSMEARFETLRLRMEGIEMRLLAEFRKAGERTELPYRGLETSRIRALEVRLDTVEDRLRKLEEK